VTPKLTDTDKTLQAVRDAAEEGAHRGARDAGTPTHGTPSPVHGMVTEKRCYEIVEEVHKRNEAERYRGCKKDGPAKELSDRIDELEGWKRTMELAEAKESGAAKAIAEAAGKTAAWRMLVISAAVGIVTLLAGKAVDRFWPAQAHAAPAQVQK
jgi:hypothetical protein